jgi:hypothetical protein
VDAVKIADGDDGALQGSPGLAALTLDDKGFRPPG